ncbi:hypothetical protein NUM3379_34880 [Kineococcus sp. NUM-3379]
MSTQQPTDRPTGTTHVPSPTTRPRVPPRWSAPGTGTGTDEAGPPPEVQHYDELSEALQAALRRWAGSAERQTAWTEHVFTLANASPCATCNGSVGLCGGYDDAGHWWCRTCIQRSPAALRGRRLRAFSCDVDASLNAPLESYREQQGQPLSHDCLAYALTTRARRNGRIGGEATIQANCRRAHEVLLGRTTPGNNPLSRRTA